LCCAPRFRRWQDRTTLPLVAMLRVNTPDTVEPMATKFRTALAALGQARQPARLRSRLADGHRGCPSWPNRSSRRGGGHRYRRRSGDPRGAEATVRSIVALAAASSTLV
jgi:hypothetical protein